MGTVDRDRLDGCRTRLVIGLVAGEACHQVGVSMAWRMRKASRASFSLSLSGRLSACSSRSLILMALAVSNAAGPATRSSTVRLSLGSSAVMVTNALSTRAGSRPRAMRAVSFSCGVSRAARAEALVVPA